VGSVGTCPHCPGRVAMALPPDPHWRSAPGPPVPTLTSEPGYATDVNKAARYNTKGQELELRV